MLMYHDFKNQLAIRFLDTLNKIVTTKDLASIKSELNLLFGLKKKIDIYFTKNLKSDHIDYDLNLLYEFTNSSFFSSLFKEDNKLFFKLTFLHNYFKSYKIESHLHYQTAFSPLFIYDYLEFDFQLPDSFKKLTTYTNEFQHIIKHKNRSKFYHFFKIKEHEIGKREIFDFKANLLDYLVRLIKNPYFFEKSLRYIIKKKSLENVGTLYLRMDFTKLDYFVLKKIKKESCLTLKYVQYSAKSDLKALLNNKKKLNIIDGVEIKKNRLLFNYTKLLDSFEQSTFMHAGECPVFVDIRLPSTLHKFKSLAEIVFALRYSRLSYIGHGNALSFSFRNKSVNKFYSLLVRWILLQIKKRNICIEVNLMSNYKTFNIPFKSSVINMLIENNVCYNLNTDDPVMFDSTLLDEYYLQHCILNNYYPMF